MGPWWTRTTGTSVSSPSRAFSKPIASSSSKSPRSDVSLLPARCRVLCDRSPAVAGCFPVRTPSPGFVCASCSRAQSLLRGFGFAARSFVVIVSPFLIPVCRRSFSVYPDKVPQRVTISVPVIKGIENNTIIYVVVLLFEVSYYCMFSLRRTGRTDGE